MQVSTKNLPTRRNNVPPAANRDANAWERGVLRDSDGRPIREGGKVIGLKTYSENKAHYDEQIRKAKSGQTGQRESIGNVGSKSTSATGTPTVS